MKRYIPALLILVAVVIAAVAALKIINGRKAIALAQAEKAAAEAEIAEQEATAAKETRVAEKVKADAAEKALQKVSVEREKAAFDVESKRLSLSNDTIRATIAREEAEALKAKAQAAADLKAKSANELAAARAQKEADELKAKAAADEKVAAQARKDAAEAETLKLKYSLNELAQMKLEYETLIAETRDMRQELEEQLRALKPEKTILDLSVVESETSQTNAVPVKDAVQIDPFESQAMKEIKDLDRLRREAAQARSAKSREETIAALEDLMKTAFREKRPIDAKYYYQTLLTLYPDWKPKP